MKLSKASDNDSFNCGQLQHNKKENFKVEFANIAGLKNEEKDDFKGKMKEYRFVKD